MSADASNIGRILQDIGLPSNITVERVTFYDSTVVNPRDTSIKSRLKKSVHDKMTQ